MIPKFVIVKCMLLIKKLFFLLDVTKRQVNGVNEKNYTACAWHSAELNLVLLLICEYIYTEKQILLLLLHKEIFKRKKFCCIK